jgi:tetratricopeptide (TPR) repeat protein
MRVLFLLAAAMTIFSRTASAAGLEDARNGADALAVDDYQIAILHYTSAIRSPDLPRDQLALSYRQRGIGHFQTGRADLAILDFTSAMWLNGLDADQMTRTYYNRGLAYEVLGESRLAVADLTTAIERNPSYAEAYNSRGHIHLKSGDHEHALADFTASHTQGNPEPHLPMYGMALTYEAMGRLEEAKAWFGRVLEVKPDFEPAVEKLHPDDLAMDAVPTPAIESSTLLPPTQPEEGEPQLRKAPDDGDALEPAAPPVIVFDEEKQRAIAESLARKDGEPLATAAESQDPRPTLIDEPVPAASPSQQAAVVAVETKPTVLEPAAAPPMKEDVAADVPSTRVATSVEVSEPSRDETLTLRQPVSSEEKPANSPQQMAAISAATKPAQPASRTASDYQIQLGAYASPAIAESEAMRLKRNYADVLSSVSHAVQRASVGSKTYFRLRGTGLNRAEAIRICKALRERDVSCVVARP